MNNLNMEILKYVIEKLIEMNIPTDKIVVQKLMFYLKECGIPISYLDFDMYAYGPYSKKLNYDADELVFEEQLTISNKKYKKGSNFKHNLSIDYQDKIIKKIENFKLLVNNDFNFRSMEIFGTAFYCYKALNVNNNTPTNNDVIEEVKAWKGTKYSDESIRNVYNKIIEIHKDI